MKIEEVNVHSDEFEFKGKKYDCELVTKRDKELILQEAETSHKEAIETLYDKETLRADHVKLYVDENGTPIYLMMIYIINYKEKGGRYACGSYYPIDGSLNKNGRCVVYPHPYQTSICW